MNEKEALTRIKTGHFGGDYGFDWQLLVDSVGIIGEMFRNGQIHKVVQCKDCRHYYGENEECGARSFYPPSGDWFCADGERK